MVMHHVQTSLIVSTLILFSLRLCINVITSDFFESVVKLSIRNPLVGKFAWNEVVNDLLWLCTFKRKYECPFHCYIETQLRRKGNFSHFSWVEGSTTNFKPTMVSLLTSCNVFAPKQHLPTSLWNNLLVFLYSKTTRWRFNSLLNETSITHKLWGLLKPFKWFCTKY